MQYSFTTTIGVDVSKNILDVFCHADNKSAQFNNAPDGIKKLIKWVQQRADESLVVIEPTGGYERMLQHMILTTEGLHLAKINARQVREFARAKGRIAKTDNIDARILAEYGIAFKPRILSLPPEYRQKLSALVKRRSQLNNSISREKTRIDKTDCEFSKQSIKDVIVFLKQHITMIDAETRNLIKENQELHNVHKIIMSVKGIGPVTASVLLAELPELGRIDHKAISSLVGVAPHNVDSGNMRGERHIHGGRQNVRDMLYMATLSAIRFHEKVRDFYQNLILRGKRPKIASVAAMRKLLIILNAQMREHYAKQTAEYAERSPA